MPNTSKGLPYPDGTEDANTLDTLIQALAEAMDVHVPLRDRVEVDFPVGTNALTAVPGLSFEVPPGKVMKFQIDLFTGPIDGDTGGSAFRMECTDGVGRWGIVSEDNGDWRDINETYFSPGVVHPASKPYFVIGGLVINSGLVTRTCQFMLAQGTNVGPPPNPVIAKAHSHIFATEVPA